jgi:hypothetical protein
MRTPRNTEKNTRIEMGLKFENSNTALPDLGFVVYVDSYVCISAPNVAVAAGVAKSVYNVTCIIMHI